MSKRPIAVDVRRAEPADHWSLVHLLLAIPPGEHIFLKQSVDDAESASYWLEDTTAVWYVAFAQDKAAGAVAVVFRDGWSAHVAELRLVVEPGHRGHGIGAALARVGLLSAVEQGAHVVDVEALAEQQGVIGLFGGLGFVPEALLTDHVRDEAGQLHDLVVLSYSTTGATSQLLTVGADEELYS